MPSLHGLKQQREDVFIFRVDLNVISFNSFATASLSLYVARNNDV